MPPRFVNGSPIWPPARKSTAIERRMSPTASMMKKINAQMVEMTTPRRSRGVVITTATTATSIQFSAGTSEFTQEPRNTTTAAMVTGYEIMSKKKHTVERKSANLGE